MDDDENSSTNVDLDNTNTRYREALYEDLNIDPLTQTKLIPEDAPLDAGVADDAFSSFDMDDATLPADNNVDILETGMDSVDGDNLQNGQGNLGDVIVNESQTGDPLLDAETETDEEIDDLDEEEIDIEE